MTGYTVHTGSTVQFSDGWDRIFGKKPKTVSKSKRKSAKKVQSSKQSAHDKKRTAGDT